MQEELFVSLSVPTKKQFFTSSELNHPDYKRQVLQNQSSVLANGPTVSTFTLPAHVYNALLHTDEDSDNHKVKEWSIMLLPYVLLLPYVVYYSIHTTTITKKFKIKNTHKVIMSV